MRRRAVLLVVMLFTASTAFACGVASGGGGGGRQVLVDYNNPDFANIAIAYFPNVVNVHPGDTVHFKQAWNGEPHSVTMGALVDEGLGIVNPLLEKYGNSQPPQDVQDQFDKAFEHLPSMFGDNDAVNQAAAQPCFLGSGTPPTDAKKPCAKRAQPDFTGKQPYYSSGFIPYAGNNGNSFDVKLASDIKPGTYHYYCDFHGPEMQGRIVVKPKGATIPSQTAVDKAALNQADALTSRVKKALKQVATGPFDLIRGADIAKFPVSDNQRTMLKGAYFAGYSTLDSNGVLASEFLPRSIHAKVGEKVTWVFVGTHTVSFDVPRYFPLLTIDKNGTVREDKRAGTAGSGPHFRGSYPDNAGDTYILDGGTWAGTGFHSSGLSVDSGDNQVVGYSLTFTKAGTYQYACLIHPKMVGTVIVK